MLEGLDTKALDERLRDYDSEASKHILHRLNERCLLNPYLVDSKIPKLCDSLKMRLLRSLLSLNALSASLGAVF